jgi:hypothetical protein
MPYPDDPTAGSVTSHGRSIAECEANAHLIAAAPALLESCQSLVDAMGKALAYIPDDKAELIEAAIAQATGDN